MNRQLRRLNERQEAAEKTAGTKAAHSTAQLKADKAQKRAKAAKARQKPRTSPKRFVKESWGELKKVEWPNRREVVTYTIVVLITVVILGAYVFALDFGFAKAIFSVLRG